MGYKQFLPFSRSSKMKPYHDFIASLPKDLKKVKGGSYYEEHHIVPQSIFKLIYSRRQGAHENTLVMTAHDHWWAHYYLWKAYEDTTYEKFVAHAFIAINNHKSLSNNLKDCELDAKEYDRLRKEFAIRITEIHTGSHCTPEQREHHRRGALKYLETHKPSTLGLKLTHPRKKPIVDHSPEAIAIRRKRALDYIKENGPFNKNKKWGHSISDEGRQHMIEGAKKRPPVKDSTRELMRISQAKRYNKEI
jgi:hypothetical protein